MLDDQAMPEQWIVRVEEKDYGPADLDTLQEWKREGRVLPTNAVRRADVELWTTAAEIPGLFEIAPPPEQEERPTDSASPAQPPLPVPPRRGFGSILGETLRIYRAGFVQFATLALLTLLPSICGQLTADFIKTTPNIDVDFRTIVAALFSLSMFALTIALWPIYIAGIQVLSAEFAAGRSLGFFAALNHAVRFWPRVATLCLCVYGGFFLLMLFGLLIAAVAGVGVPSLFTVVFALGLLVLQVWMFGRFFMNVLFWQQFAVLENAGVVDSLRASKELARSGAHLPWFQRPLWRGAFIASLWFLIVLLIAFAQEWPQLRHAFTELMTAQDPQALLQKVAAAQQTHGFDLSAAALSLMQRIFQPLLGIAFVVLYLDSSSAYRGEE